MKQKRKRFGQNTPSKRGDVLGVFSLPLKTRGGGAGSLIVGPGGPLVRFDQSPLPPLLCPRRGGASGDRRRRTVFLRGHLRAGMDPPLLGGPSGGRRVAGGGGSRRRRAPRRRGLRGTE